MLDDRVSLLAFALPCSGSCSGSPESISELVLALKQVSQYLCQWPLPVGQVLMDLFQKNKCMSCEQLKDGVKQGIGIEMLELKCFMELESFRNLVLRGVNVN